MNMIIDVLLRLNCQNIMRVIYSEGPKFTRPKGELTHDIRILTSVAAPGLVGEAEGLPVDGDTLTR